MDVNYWGLICVPLGIAVCFGPVLLVWCRMATRPSSNDQHEKKP